MKNTIKIVSLFVVAVMIFSFICACNVNNNTTQVTTQIETISTTNETTQAPATETTAQETETTQEITTDTEKPVVVEKVTKAGNYDIRYTGDFDEDNIVLQFGALSDIHQNGTANSPYYQKYVSALQQLKNISGGKLDAVAIAGDLTDGCTRPQWQQVISGYLTTFEPEETYFIYSMGNHDSAHQYTTNFEYAQGLFTHSGHDFFAALSDDTPEDMKKIANYHYEVNGFHFLTVTIEYYNNGADCSISQATRTWLDNSLKTITTENPDQPVFVLVHAMIYDTVYGSTLNTGGNPGWYTSYLTDILSKYPQVVTFSGHLHFPLNDEKSIMQTKFTSLGCASVRYMAIEDGGYDDMKSKTVMNDCEEYSQGYFVQVDGNGAIRLVRMDFYHGETIKDAWVIPPTKADGSHLTKYTKDRANNDTPYFTGECELKERRYAATSLQLNLTFAKALDDDLIHHYVVMVIDQDGKVVQTNKILADFYLHADPEDMAKTWSKELRGIPYGQTYTIAIYAYDSWDNQSEPLKLQVTPIQDPQSFVVKKFIGDVEIEDDVA